MPFSGAPLTEEEKSTKGTLPWRFDRMGCSEQWAGVQWEQAPPDIKSYATDIQLLGWRLKMGMATKYKVGATPEKIIQASDDLWNNGFGCLELIEDSLVGSPGFQFVLLDGDGFCHGTCLKKCQYICALRILMVQTLLFPNENLMTYSDRSGGPAYPGRDIKLRHLE